MEAMENRMEKKVYEVYCNSCGKRIETTDSTKREDYISIKKEWGYFSKKDLQVHKFNLCEECYDRITSSFAVPVEISEKTEVMSMPFSVTIHGTATPYSHSSP